MKNVTSTAAVCWMLAVAAGGAQAAPASATPAPATAAKPAGPKTNFIDHSPGSLIDSAGASAVLAANIPAKVLKLYPANKYAFVSQVEGGLTAANACVVTARVMLLPVTPAMKAPLFRPAKTATAFDTQAGATADQCKTMARDKLKEATLAVVSALVKT
jgi:hypothetical protein